MNQDAKQLLEKFRTDPIDLKAPSTSQMKKKKKFTPLEIAGCIVSVSMILYGGYHLLPLHQIITTAENKTAWETEAITTPKQQKTVKKSNNKSVTKLKSEGATQLAVDKPKKQSKQTKSVTKKKPVQTASVQPKKKSQSPSTKKTTQPVTSTSNTRTNTNTNSNTTTASTQTPTVSHTRTSNSNNSSWSLRNAEQEHEFVRYNPPPRRTQP